MQTFYDVIKKPIVSEKSTLLTESKNAYVFEVAAAANKQEIKQAVEKLFKVKVSSINTQIVQGKLKRTGQFLSKRKNWKKATVTLKEGQKIELFQGV